MQNDGIIFRPKYNGSMRFAIYLWPVWVILFGYFLYHGIDTHSVNPDGMLAFIFGAMAATLPFRIFREARFGDEITVLRYLMPKLIIQYTDITRVSAYGIQAKTGNISLQMLQFESAKEFGKIIDRLVKEKKISLKKSIAR